jgi:hypothetical protein
MKHEHNYDAVEWRRVEYNGVLGWKRECPVEDCPFIQFTTTDPASTDPVERALHKFAFGEDGFTVAES